MRAVLVVASWTAPVGRCWSCWSNCVDDKAQGGIQGLHICLGCRVLQAGVHAHCSGCGNPDAECLATYRPWAVAVVTTNLAPAHIWLSLSYKASMPWPLFVYWVCSLLLWSTVILCRVEAGGNRRVIDDLLKADMLEVLRANDQLKRERQLGKVFWVSASCLLWHCGTTKAHCKLHPASWSADKLWNCDSTHVTLHATSAPAA